MDKCHWLGGGSLPLTKSDSIILSPQGLLESDRVSYLVHALNDRLDDLTQPKGQKDLLRREVARLKRYFRELDLIVYAQTGRTVDTKWMFEFLAQQKKSLWVNSCQGIENVLPPGSIGTNGQSPLIKVEDGNGKSVTFESVKKFSDKNPAGSNCETIQALCRHPFKCGDDETKTMDNPTRTARFAIILFDKNVCNTLKKHPKLCTHGVPNVLRSILTICSLADHDYIHGIAVPWRDSAAHPFPSEFGHWQQRILGGTPLFLEHARNKPHIDWPNNYEVLSQRAVYEVMQYLKRGAVLSKLKAGLNDIQEFKRAALTRGDLSSEVCSAMCNHLAKNMARFASHILPIEVVERAMSDNGYHFKPSEFAKMMQSHSAVPAGDPTATRTPYVDTVRELLPLFEGSHSEEREHMNIGNFILEAFDASVQLAKRAHYPLPDHIRSKAWNLWH